MWLNIVNKNKKVINDNKLALNEIKINAFLMKFFLDY